MWCVALATRDETTIVSRNLSSSSSDQLEANSTSEVAPTKHFPQPAPILDFAWYPYASSRDPSMFCFLASVRECPVKLLDAIDGRVRGVRGAGNRTGILMLSIVTGVI